jgi:hypothetical protein
MRAWRIAWLVGAVSTAPCLMAGCGGESSSPAGTNDGGATDATIDSAAQGDSGEAGLPNEASASDTLTAGDTGLASDANSTDDVRDAAEAGLPPCPPPADPTTSSLCISLNPEAIAFLSDPAFDGKGLLVLQLFSRPHPDDDAGDSAVTPPLLLPSQPDGGTADGGFALLDLSQPVPQVRFDGLPTLVYARAVFVDDPTTLGKGGVQAGWWLAGLDLANGIDKAPLSPVALTAGQGTSVSLDLIALRKLTVTVARASGIAPAGNGQGPVVTVAIDTDKIGGDAGGHLWGAGALACGKVDGISQAVVQGFVIGKGPYWIVASLDDFGVDASFPAGGLSSLILDGGGLFVPASDKVMYPANAYQVTATAALTFVSPWEGGVDPVSCP